MLLAKDVMKKELLTLKPEDTVKEIARRMVNNKVSGMPVTDDAGNVLGVVSENDLLKKSIKPEEPAAWTIAMWAIVGSGDKIDSYHNNLRKWLGSNAEDIMTSPAICVDVNDELDEVGKVMLEKGVKRVFVTEKGKLAGVISRSAFVKLLLDYGE